MDITVRRARPKDIPAMVRFGEVFWRQTDYFNKHGIAYDADSISQMVEHLLDKGIVQIALDGNRLVGLIMLVVGPMPFCPNIKCATELAFYTDEGYRNKGIGKRLLQQAENIAKQLGVNLFTMIHLDSVLPENAEALYVQEGYTKNETLFTKEI